VIPVIENIVSFSLRSGGLALDWRLELAPESHSAYNQTPFPAGPSLSFPHITNQKRRSVADFAHGARAIA
jgi:hypothetical protein